MNKAAHKMNKAAHKMNKAAHKMQVYFNPLRVALQPRTSHPKHVNVCKYMEATEIIRA